MPTLCTLRLRCAGLWQLWARRLGTPGREGAPSRSVCGARARLSCPRQSRRSRCLRPYRSACGSSGSAAGRISRGSSARPSSRSTTRRVTSMTRCWDECPLIRTPFAFLFLTVSNFNFTRGRTQARKPEERNASTRRRAGRLARCKAQAYEQELHDRVRFSSRVDKDTTTVTQLSHRGMVRGCAGFPS